MGEVLVITSGKGGVGKTTTAANIGTALSLLGKKVVIVDADIGLRNLDVVMGLENRIVYDIVDVTQGICRLKQALIKDKRYDGLYLLPAAQTKDKTAIQPKQMLALSKRLKEEFDYILIDCPAGIEQGFKNAIAGADKAIVVTAPEVSAKFFNKRTTFEIPMSFAERQVKSSFSSAQQLNSFFSMIQSAIENSMTIRNDGLIMSTINNMIAETLAVSKGENEDFSGFGDSRAVNLLALYNDRFSKELTALETVTNPEFIRWASFYMGLYASRMSKLSTLFNIGGKERFTTSDKLHIILLDEFAQAANAYLQSDTFHEQYTALPNAETVPYWQGSGTDYSFESTSSINVKNGNTEVEASGILGVMFDREALGVTNLDRHVYGNYNPRRVL